FRSPVAPPVYTIKPRHFSLGLKVSQQGEVQLAVVAERRMAPCAVHRDTKEFGVEFLKLGKHLVIESHLVAADWTPVGGIKHEHDGPPAKLTQFHGLIGRALKREVRRGR